MRWIWQWKVLLCLVFFVILITPGTAATGVDVRTKIVYAAYLGEPNLDIFIMNPDGSGKIDLSNNPARDDEPALSPDGTKIAFSSNRDGNYEIYLMNPDGSNLVRLTNNLVRDSDPAWSPDGTKIAFTSYNSGQGAIYTMNPDGSGLTRVTSLSNYDNYDPEWSPDASKIAFITNRNGAPELFVYRMDGSGESTLLPYRQWGQHPTWSPDGTRIAFSDWISTKIFSVNIDGSGLTQLTPSREAPIYDYSAEYDPAWSIDGTRIAFMRYVVNWPWIFVVNADGSGGLKGLTPSAVGGSYGWDPSWGIVENSPPKFDVINDFLINEGEALSFDLDAYDPDNDTLAYSANLLMEGAVFDSDTRKFFWIPDFSQAGSYTATFTVSDGTLSDTLSVNVVVKDTNRPPVLDTIPDKTVDELTTLTFTALSSDPDGDTPVYSLEGAPAGAVIDATTGEFSWTPSETQGFGSYSFKVKVTDTGSPSLSDDEVVVVVVKEVNTAPKITSFTLPSDQPVALNTPVVPTAIFSDVDADSVTAVINWGDGNSDATGSHVYASPGVYTLILTVTDPSGAFASASYEYAVIYDPNGGYVSGHGTILSPVNSDCQYMMEEGKAKFGFVSKYERGANVPIGKTVFQFKTSNLDFSSSSYDWLVVAGARAQFKGTGTINDEGNFGFLLTAIDGSIPGGNGADKFRIKIWNKGTGTIVYDNQAGAADDGAPVTLIETGNIIIHK